MTELTDVTAILPRGTDVYLGGVRGSVGGMPRTCAARVDASTGAVANWTPGGTSVFALAADGDRILIGDANGFTAVAP